MEQTIRLWWRRWEAFTAGFICSFCHLWGRGVIRGTERVKVEQRGGEIIDHLKTATWLHQGCIEPLFTWGCSRSPVWIQPCFFCSGIYCFDHRHSMCRVWVFTCNYTQGLLGGRNTSWRSNFLGEQHHLPCCVKVVCWLSLDVPLCFFSVMLAALGVWVGCSFISQLWRRLKKLLHVITKKLHTETHGPQRKLQNFGGDPLSFPLFQLSRLTFLVQSEIFCETRSPEYVFLMFGASRW